MHMYWQYAGVALALLMYYLFLRDVLRGVLKQSLATWGLWGVLDLITTISIIQEGGNWLILAVYTAGSLVLCFSLAYKKQFAWTWFESFTVLLVGVCLLAWYFLGPKATTIAGTASVALATLPQLKDSWLKPDRDSAQLWTGWFVVNTLFFLGGASWEVKEVLYPIVCMGLCLSLVVVNRSQCPA